MIATILLKVKKVQEKNDELEEKLYKMTSQAVTLISEAREAAKEKAVFDKAFANVIDELSGASSLNHIAARIVERHKRGKHNLYSEKDPPDPAPSPPRTVHVITSLSTPSRPPRVSYQPISPTTLRPNPSLVPAYDTVVINGNAL